MTRKVLLIAVLATAGALFFIELGLPGHFALLSEYFSGVGTLFSQTYGTPTLQNP